MDTDENHKQFLKNLAASTDSVFIVAKWLQSKGFPVRVNPTSFAKSHDEWRKHADSGDLEIGQRVEVKHLSAVFTGRADWPYGENYIVCAKHAFDEAKPKPYAFVALNEAQTHAGIVYGRDSGTWRVARRKDSRYDREQDFYFAPIESVRWDEVGTKILP